MELKLTDRVQTCTHDRAVHFKNIIQVMRGGELKRSQIQALTGMSNSGGSRYVQDLKENGIIIQKPTLMRGHVADQIFKLTDDQALITEFLRQIDRPGLDGQPRRRHSLNNGTADRKVHLAKDDEVFRVKIAPAKPPKQFDLLLHLFGRAPDEGLLS